MVTGTGAVENIAQKYLPEVLAGIEHPLDYRDARVEKDKIVVKGRDEMDLALRGWLGYAVPVRRGKLGRVEPVVLGEPSTSEFLAWAKGQSVKTLTRYLAEQRIRATGNIVFMLAYRLTYCYEEIDLKRRGAWPLAPERMEVRQRRIKSLDLFIHVNGVGNHPDEQSIVQQMFHEDGLRRHSTTLTGKESPVPEEKRSETLARLRKQAEDAEKTGGSGKKKDATPESGDESKSGASEVDAVKAGKAGKAGKTGKKRAGKAPAEPIAASTESEPAAAATDDPTPTPAEGGEVMTTKKKGTTKKVEKKAAAPKAEKKKAAAPKPKAEKKAKSTATAKDFPIGTKVKYLGTRVKHHVGKTGEVVGHRSEIGLAIKWSDGLVATATAGAVEKVGK